MNFEPKNGDFEKLTSQLSNTPTPPNLGQSATSPGQVAPNGVTAAYTNQPNAQVSAQARAQSQAQAQAQAQRYSQSNNRQSSSVRRSNAQASAPRQAQTSAITDASDPLHPRRTGFKLFMFVMTFLVVFGCMVDRSPELLTFWLTWVSVLAFTLFFFAIFYFADRRAAKKRLAQ